MVHVAVAAVVGFQPLFDRLGLSLPRLLYLHLSTRFSAPPAESFGPDWQIGKGKEAASRAYGCVVDHKAVNSRYTIEPLSTGCGTVPVLCLFKHAAEMHVN